MEPLRKGPYRRYLQTGEPMPRRTEYRRRVRERAEARQAALQNNSDSDQENFGNHERVQEVRQYEVGDNCASESSDLDANMQEDQNEIDRNSNSEARFSSSGSDSNLFHSDYSERPEDENDSDMIVSNSEPEDEAAIASDEHSAGSDPEVEQPFGEPNDDQNEWFNFQQNEGPQLATPLCPCTETSEGDVLIMCLGLAMRHNLSWVAVVDVLKMINVCYGSEVVSATKYFFYKYMDISKNDAKFHMYCQICDSYLGERDTFVDEVNLACGCQQRINRPETFPSYYVAVDLQRQFKQLLEQPDVANEILTYRFERQRSTENAIEDIYDGTAYQNLSRGVLSNQFNFSYSFNTDGVSLTNSSTQSVWPIYLQINELSPKNRKKHMILAGMWVGKKDPNMRIFLKSFVQEANLLITNGVAWVDGNGDQRVSKIFPTCVIVDSGARYKLLNMSSFNAYYGCTFCYHKAVNSERGRRFSILNNVAPLRTHESTQRDMVLAFENRNNRNAKQRIVRGTKGPSPLLTMLHLNLDVAFVVDYMHSALLGNTRSHFSYLLNSCGTPYYIGCPDKTNQISQRLLSIRPPHCITRTPRKISEVKYWKASEWRSMLLFYCIVCLKGILKTKYLSHIGLLSSAFYILLKKSTREELDVANHQLLNYMRYTQQYFGIDGMVYNVHLLMHLVTSVVHWGPLWTHSTFEFEGENHHLVQMHTGPGQVAYQLTRRYLMYSALPSLCAKYGSTEAALDFTENLTGKKLKSFLRCGDTVLFGRGSAINLSIEETDALNFAQIQVQGEIIGFAKFLRKGLQYSTLSFSSGKKNCDAYVTLRGGIKGVIKKIIRAQTNDGVSVIILIKKLIIQRSPIFKTDDVTITHIQKVLGEGDLIAVGPHSLDGQCIYIDLPDEGKFISVIPIGCYSD